MQSVEKQLCPIPEKAKEDGSGRSFHTSLSNNVPCSMALKMQGQKFGLLSFKFHSAPVSCLFMRNPSCCQLCKMGLMTLYSAQKAEKMNF